MHRDTTDLLSYLSREITPQERSIYDTLPYELQRQAIILPVYTFLRHSDDGEVREIIEQPTFVIPLSTGIYVLDYGETPCENISKITSYYFYRVPYREIFTVMSNVRRFSIGKHQAPRTLLRDEIELFMMCALRCDPHLLDLRTFTHVKMKRVIYGLYNDIHIDAHNFDDEPRIQVVIRRDNSGNLFHVYMKNGDEYPILVGEMHPKNRTPVLFR